jgi:hypothetical protein
MVTPEAASPDDPGSVDTDAGTDAVDDAERHGSSVLDVARMLAATAMLGAAVIHFAFAPEHFDDQTSHGVFFLAAGWLQLLGAAGLAFAWQPQRTWLRGTAALNGAIAALWLLTRTAGLPGESAEAVGFPDSLAAVLQVVAAVAALSVAGRWLADRPIERPAFAVTGVPAVAMIALVTASVVPSLGGGHSHADGHGHDGDAPHGDAPHGPVDGELAAGHGHGAPDDDWDDRRYAALTGHLPDDEVDRIRQINREFLADQIRERSRTLGDLPEDEAEARIAEFVDWSIDNALDAENGSATDGDEATMHSHGITEWQDLTDPEDIAALQAELQVAGTVIDEMATAADAMAAGYIQVTPYVPGIGAHYLNVDLLREDGFDPGNPEMLLYNGNKPTSELVGLSYAVLGDEPPEGFTGPNDEWHVHPSLCIIGALVVGPDSTPDELCESIGGRKGMGFDKPMWMGHLWQVPGWESPWGLFSGENPTLNLATADLED